MKLYLLRRYVTPDFDTRDIVTMSMLATLLPIVAGSAWVMPSTLGIRTAAAIIAPTVLFLFTIAKYTFQQGAMNVVVPLIERQLLRLSGMLPENIALVALLSALPVLMLYALLERQFSRSENLDPPPPA